MNIGILGGTFNPVHLGHLLLAEGALETLGLERILWVPARLPPHKPVDGPTPAEDRCRMVELAIAGLSRFELSRVELDRPGPSYTVDTLLTLRHQRPGDAWLILIGSDMLADLHRWHKIREAMTLATFAAVPRPGMPVGRWPAGVARFDTPTLDISSSTIRDRVRRGRSIRYLVPEAVRRYIEDRGFYR